MSPPRMKTGLGLRLTAATVGVALAVLGGCGATSAPPPAHVFPVWDHALPSGLRVVIENDDVSGLAGVVAIVEAGAVDDPPGKAGLAHALEHLMFRSPDGTGLSTFKRLTRLGTTSVNGETGLEATTYRAFGGAQALDRLLAIVLGRLADPTAGATDEMWAKEVSIVEEELRRRQGPSGLEWLIPELMSPGHPYDRVFAERGHVGDISLADARAFAERYYRPERMTIVISGPISPAWEESLSARIPAALRGRDGDHIAPVRRQPPAVVALAPAPPALPRRTAKVDGPELWMGWRLPPATGLAAKEVEVFARTVGAVLAWRVGPDGPNDVLDFGVDLLPGELSSELVCFFKLRSEADAARIREETARAVEDLADETLVSVTGQLKWGYQRAALLATLQTAVGMESVEGRARARADLAHAGQSPMLSTMLDMLGKVDSDQMSEFAAAHLRGNQSRAVLIVPEVAALEPMSPEVSKGRVSIGGPERDEPTPESEPPDETDLQNFLRQAASRTPQARAAVVRRLSNGLTVIALKRPGLPFASAVLGFHADPQPADSPGARSGAMGSLRWDVSMAPWQRGLLLNQELSADSLEESLGMFSERVDDALDFLSELGDSIHVLWPSPDFDRWADRTSQSQATAQGRLQRAFRTALFGDHPYHLDPPIAQVRRVKGDEAQRWLERVRRPTNGALVIVGEIDPLAVVNQAEHELRGWKGTPGEPPTPPGPPPPHKPAQQPVPVQYVAYGAQRFADVRFGCLLPPVESPRDAIVDQLLAALVSSDLFTRLRWKQGVSYAPVVQSLFVRGGTAWLEGRLDVSLAAATRAVDAIRPWFGGGGAGVKIDPKVLETVRWNLARRSLLANTTNAELAHAVFTAWNMGWSPDSLDDAPANVASITVDDLERRLAACQQSAVVQVLGSNAP